MSTAATNDNNIITRHLFVLDHATKTPFLVDSGADLSVYPKRLVRGPLKRTKFDLCAANGTIIPTFGSTAITLDLGLRRDFSWNFVIAQISKPIIGADFISHYGLLIDLENNLNAIKKQILFLMFETIRQHLIVSTCYYIAKTLNF